MTDRPAPPAPAHHDTGRLGDRELVCVQTIDIGRLRSAPVPITPGTFVAVSGRGPKGDSNGSGKTTFLAAVSLLHGEIGWHLASGASEATSLLFDGTKAGVDVQRYARADHGYVIGVFRGRGEDDEPVTVWLRINAAAPVLRARAQTGVHLVDAATSTARAAAADALWAQLPKPEWGSRTYAHELFGAAPRCMAWLQARGNQTPGKSLLRLSQEMLEPEQIGAALLELLGRDDVLDQDRAARAELDATTRDVEERLNDDITRRRQEDDELRAIYGREQARRLLGRADRLWELHYAKGLCDGVARADQARGGIRPAGDDRRAARRSLRETTATLDSLGDGDTLKADAASAADALEGATETLKHATSAKAVAQARLSTTLAKVDELSIAAAGWDGITTETLTAAETAAEEAVRTAAAALAVAAAYRASRDKELQAAEAGTAGAAAETAARLAPAGVSATPLLDEIDLEPATRHTWEPRLALYRDAVVVAAADRDRALDAAVAGDVLVSGDPAGHTAPTGVRSAPAPALPFLTWLAGHGASSLGDAHGGHVTVVGGFDRPITGREARVDAARAAAALAAIRETDAGVAHTAALSTLATVTERLRAAHAAVQLTEARRTVNDVREEVGALDRAETEAALANRAAVDAHRAASEAWGGYAERRRRLEEARERDERHLAQMTLTLRQAIESWIRQRSHVPYWSQRWGGDLTSASNALAADSADAADHPTGDDRSSSGAYRRAANHAIDRALLACGIDSATGAGAAPGSGVDLAVDERNRAGGIAADDDERGQSYERQASAFHAVADALGAWLNRLEVEDRASAAHIAADRDRRTTALNAAQELCAERGRQLPILQDGIERLLRTSISAVAEKLNELDLAAQGSGADLLIEVQRPATAKDSWLWRVIPRYRRGPAGGLVPYTERANTATEKLLAIHLVLAALFAATAGRGADRGRVLVLDELGDSLGDYHREAVLQALAYTAAESGITVLGTCQDGVLEDAARHCGLLLYFQFRDPSDVLNAPTRVFGTTDDGHTVEQTGPWIERLG